MVLGLRQCLHLECGRVPDIDARCASDLPCRDERAVLGVGIQRQADDVVRVLQIEALWVVCYVVCCVERKGV